MSSAAESASTPAPLPLQLKTILYATNFGEESENAGKYAALMARAFDAELLVVHTFVLTQAAMEMEAEQPGARSTQRAELQAMLKMEAQRLGAGLRGSDYLLLETPDAEEQIPELARRREPAMIVLGTQARGRVGRALIGSVSEKIQRAAGGPSLVVGPQAPPCREGDAPIRRVLYATELSPAAARGAAYAVAMSEKFQAEMDVLHVLAPEDAKESGELSGVQARFQAEVAAMVPHRAGFIAAPHAVLATGTAHARILEHIREHSIDLLVLSLRRSSHLWLETRLSGAFDIIAEAACPVLTVVG